MDRERLSRENGGLVYKIARRYARVCEFDRAIDLEDLVQIGHIGLWKAAETFDPGLGKSWAGWAAWYIAKEIRAEAGLNRRRAHWDALSFETPVGGAEGDTLTLGETLAADVPEAGERLELDELREQVRAAVARLKDERTRAAVCGDARTCAGRLRRGYAELRRDRKLRDLAEAYLGRCYHHVTLTAFKTTHTSAVEKAVLWKEEQDEKRSDAGQGAGGADGN